MARSAGFGGDFFFHLNRLRLRVTLQLGQVRTVVSLRRYVRHLPHDPFELGRLLRLLLIVERDFFAKFPRICHLCDVFCFSLDLVSFFSMHACKMMRIRFSLLVFRFLGGVSHVRRFRTPFNYSFSFGKLPFRTLLHNYFSHHFL